MRVLAIDIGRKMGWAHSCGLSGTWDLNVRRDESAGMRLIRMRAKLNEILDTEGIDMLAFEAVRNAAPGMQGALVVGAEFQGVIKEWCEDNDIQYRGYSPTEIKRFATGRGNVGKGAMKDAARKAWKGEVSIERMSAMDDNEIDARWLLKLVMSEYEKGERQ